MALGLDLDRHVGKRRCAGQEVGTFAQIGGAELNLLGNLAFHLQVLAVVVRVDETFVVVFFTGLLFQDVLFAGIATGPLGSWEAAARTVRLGESHIRVEYLLRMRANLRTGARWNEVLDFGPVLAVLSDR